MRLLFLVIGMWLVIAVLVGIYLGKVISGPVGNGIKKKRLAEMKRMRKSYNPVDVLQYKHCNRTRKSAGVYLGMVKTKKQ